MKQDLIRFENNVLKIMRENEIYLRQHEFDALVSMTYNLGSIYFLVDLLKTGNRNLSDWRDIITIRMVKNKGTEHYYGLMNRRYQEINLFLYCDYEGGPDVKTYP
jgi:Phage-related lysozyme (muraminidase)